MDDFESSFLSRLPYEVWCMIFKLLSQNDKTAAEFAYPFVFSRHRHINVRNNFCFSKENIVSLLQLHTNPDVVTKLDFNFCYWIPRNEIVHFVKQCKNLKELAVAHSTIGSKDLEEILSENVKISKLSISIHYPETFEQNEKLVDHYLHQSTVLEDPLSFIHLGKCRQTFAQLESLELHMGQYPIIFATLISACKILENLTLTLDVEVHAGKWQTYQARTENITKPIGTILETDSWRQFPLTKTLKSFVLQHSSGNENISLNQQMKKVIQEIVKRSATNLRCFWTSIPSLAVDLSLFNWNEMIAWNHSQIRLTSATESFVSNFAEHREPVDLTGRPSQLKQIEGRFVMEDISPLIRAHPYLKRLRFNKDLRRHYINWTNQDTFDWSLLEHIKVLSIHPTVIKNMDRNKHFRPILYKFLTACTSLEELEICKDFIELTMDKTNIRADSLCELKVCNTLNKFSISSTTLLFSESNLAGRSFLEDIVSKCPNLEVLYVQDLNTCGHVIYYDCLKRFFLALQSARKLRLLRLKLEVYCYRIFVQMIHSFTYCHSLVQLSLITTSKFQLFNDFDEKAFTNLFVDLVERLPKLIALLVVLPGAAPSNCRATTFTLVSKFHPTRPCFCVQITDSLESNNPPKLPLVHYKTLAEDQPPSVGGLPYHLIASDQIY